MRTRFSRVLKVIAIILQLVMVLPVLPIMGVIKVKSAQETAKKWGEVTPGRSQFYESGAKGAGQDWENNTIAASSAFKAAVTAGNIENLFKGGVKNAGAAKYGRKVTDVGVARFSQGVTAGIPDYAAGVQPMLETIATVTLSPRQPRGSEANLNRVREVATALHKKRLAIRAAGQ